jgi:hypothetical protein
VPFTGFPHLGHVALKSNTFRIGTTRKSSSGAPEKLAIRLEVTYSDINARQSTIKNAFLTFIYNPSIDQIN